MSAAKAEAHNDIDKLSFEEALAQLEKIVGQLESGEAPLEKSIELYERGTALKAHCETRLKAAEARVEKITLSASGEPSGTEPLDVG
ncbi:exodeoxyribonuclease VII, small subunit [Parvibaculum lavamentivorans DS-1]|uniref:Exodeoxyribonuclease 7 small subunit n=1 Tax=Parvibaculum lavamentivorans (strain DS-1 / DSM 13023 / NCIMB 13966) TaxID=402881 RepID=A7HR69_PARL1|nr:exodeoxyribonuclease VII small subunit [Parvibaculum lavamentivorans]ABS62402.1 exodeoxyribonuclease VII, small subunit [Parvibaculum lavamentivorans DS-1]